MTLVSAKRETPENSFVALEKMGQSVWLDFIDRDLLSSGKLADLVVRVRLKGLTSNPSIFEKAIAGTSQYDEEIQRILKSGDYNVKELYEEIAIGDIRQAADALRGVYDRTSRADGYACFEVSPVLARSTEGTIEEARRLWKKIDRPNVMIKVPGTPEGVPAIRELISEGINVNVTLLFSEAMYVAVANAYIEGLEDRARRGEPIDGLASVASFFISRIDQAVDKRIEDEIASSSDPLVISRLESLRGKIAVANARVAYSKYKEIVGDLRWRRLAALGAHPQRLLWASTGTKNPMYSDVLYIEELIGADTVNTMPPATLTAFEDHGVARAKLGQRLEDARNQLAALAGARISLDAITDKLMNDGIELFKEPFEKLMLSLEKKRRLFFDDKINDQQLDLPIGLMTVVGETLRDWKINQKGRRLWDRDTSLWTGHDESGWLDWLSIVDQQLDRLPEFLEIRKDILSAEFRDAVLLGMGGSSLAPEVFDMTFDTSFDFPEFHVLDSTDPEQIDVLESKLAIEDTLFIVSSKSGSTLEPNIFFEYFFDKIKKAVGEKAAGSHFIAITDPASKLDQTARERGFRHVFHGKPGIGGRYSALSDFGIIPALIMGVDVERLLRSARRMIHSCSPDVPVAENPGIVLGAVLGALGSRGWDKVTVIASSSIWALSPWIEQLLAESTGKTGKALIPVSEEPIGHPSTYGADRVFVYLRTTDSKENECEGHVDQLRAFGYPVVKIRLEGPYSIGQEFFRWEIATAVAGSIMGINPFDQPDVEASKIATRQLTDKYEKTGSLGEEPPFYEEEGIALYADESNARAIQHAGGAKPSLATLLKAHVDRLKTGDYFALMAYLNMNYVDEDLLQNIRKKVLDTKHVATCLGFGPRFLHSTGQAYKGGPRTGVFLQITADDARDLPIPGHRATFGIVKAAQARGDFSVLCERGRRCLRVHLKGDRMKGLKTLFKALSE
jgi:transaldolase/glucose-6-phosphate isomerase